MNKVPEVLFVCIHNAGRSVAASVLLEHYAQGRVRVSSAGSNPGKDVNPNVARILKEMNLDPSKEFPKPLTDSAQKQADIVITMGCGDACTFYPGKRYIDWELEDPSDKPLDVVREIVSEIERRVVGLLDEIDTGA
ncbi:MAG: arsenate reductase ArsC [Actinomycetota bacterium]|nr:MAG: arsenate reductase ArsC [Actinomycetota bacterium]